MRHEDRTLEPWEKDRQKARRWLWVLAAPFILPFVYVFWPLLVGTKLIDKAGFTWHDTELFWWNVGMAFVTFLWWIGNIVFWATVITVGGAALLTSPLW